MTKEEEEKLFISFLRKNKCTTAYKTNIKNNGYSSLEDVFSYIHNPMSFIHGAFVFKATKEDHPFWQNLHNKWLKTLKEHE